MDGYLYISYYGDQLVEYKNFDTFDEFDDEIKDCIFKYFGNKRGFKNNMKVNKVLRYVMKPQRSGWYILDFTTEIDYYTLDTSHSKHITPLLKAALRNMKLEKLGIL